jgi:hypothetical protein
MPVKMTGSASAGTAGVATLTVTVELSACDVTVIFSGWRVPAISEGPETVEGGCVGTGCVAQAASVTVPTKHHVSIRRQVELASILVRMILASLCRSAPVSVLLADEIAPFDIA